MSNNPIDPPHYNKYPIEPFEFFYRNGIPYPECDIMRYLIRWQDKNGLEDLKKARQLLNMLIERVEGKEELEAELKGEEQRRRQNEAVEAWHLRVSNSE